MSAENETVQPAVIRQGEWMTSPDCKRVLVVVHTVTYAQRLRDVFTLFEGDLRVQVVFTLAPHAFGAGTHQYLRSLGIVPVPWEQAVGARYDLALAAGSRGVEQVRAPLVRLSHGAGQIKLQRGKGGGEAAPGTANTAGAAGERTAGMLSRDHLLHGGRLVPAAVALAHEEDVRQLARSCPEALPVASVVGDPCHDRIMAGLGRRAEYREALGLADGQRLVVVPSTWGPSSSFGRFDALLPRLLGELPREKYRVAALVHPNVWAGHGRWQVRGWLAACLRAGLVLVPPEEEWEALLIAADWIIGDHGSVTCYGALTGAPVLLARYPHHGVTTDSPASRLAVASRALDPMLPLARQLEFAAAHHHPEQYAEVGARMTSAPGEFAARMRALMYRLLGIGEPARLPVPHAAVPPLPSRLLADRPAGARP